MLKKQPWMKLGALVSADGRTGYISQREQKTIDKVEYVLWFKVKHPGEKFSTRYKTNQVTELEGAVAV
jgi:hypothetical protein